MSTDTVEAISGAEFKTRLGGLGLPPSWFAERRDVTMRTVVRWFDGDIVTPDIVADLVYLEELTLKEIRKVLEKVPDEGHVVLKTWRVDNEYRRRPPMPASWHRALTHRALEHLKAQGRTVTVQYG